MNSRSYFCTVCGAPIKRQQKQSVFSQKTKNIEHESVCENDHICSSCCKLAVQSYRQSKARVTLDMEVFEDTKQSLNGKCSKNRDNTVCLMCKTSLSERKSLVIIKHDPTELDDLIVNLISKAIPPQTKIHIEDKVCSKCWFKVKKSAINSQQINKMEPKEFRNENQSVHIKSEPESDQEPECLIVEHHSEDFEDDKTGSEHEDSDNSDDTWIDDPEDLDFTVKYHTTNDKIPQKVQNHPEASEEIQLPNYKRCPNNSHSCVFRGCKNPERHRIPNQIREKMLRDHMIYISKGMRACKEHIQLNNWHDLSILKNEQYKFNAKQIEDMFSMVQIKKNTDLDFTNVLNFDDYFIEHLLGIKRDILTSILMKEPQINIMCNGVNGLLGLLLKHQNGGPDVRIKSLLNISRTTLKRAMEDVKKILSKSPVTKELHIEYLLKIK